MAIASAFVLFAASFGSAAAETVPAFDLPRWHTGERVRLEDFAGQILVLDFFAYWCAPCERASQELETGVQQFYAARKGNARGAPVRVVSVNLERNNPDRTEEFLRQTRASFVVNDFSGSLLKHFGQSGIPFLVIIDGTAPPPGAPRSEVVYRHAGFEGVGKLRQIIDRLGEPCGRATPSVRRRPGVAPEEPGAGGSPVLHTIDADSEIIGAADIFLTDAKLRYGEERGDTQWDVAFSYASFDEDYRPSAEFDLLGFREHLHEDRFGGQFNFRQRWLDSLTMLGSGGLYDGYPDYRRVWIANRYRQKYDAPGYPRIPPYTPPDPKGWNISTGARWEYLPTAGFAELKLGYAYDQTAPGYEDSTDPVLGYRLIRGRVHLDTELLSVSSENVLTRRLRALNEVTFTHTSGRKLRFAYQGSLNLALGERWVVRGYGGISTEAPRFDAHFLGVTVEYEVIPRLLLSLTGRSYKDTGEIEDSLLTSSAAPALRSWEAGAGLRYAWRRASLKVYVAPFWTDYAPVPPASTEFSHLYTDRNWVLAQIAGSLQF